MIGDGPLKSKAQNIANTFSLPVSFLGACDQKEVLKNLQRSSIFCLPSITAESGDAEGLPISILEAQACAVDVVTSAKGAEETDSIISRTVVFPEGDEEALADALIELLRNPIRNSSISSESNNLPESFYIKNSAKNLENIYNQNYQNNG
ncbi:hypothetical protein GCM10022265_22680 [Marinobacter xestospongiae]